MGAAFLPILGGALGVGSSIMMGQQQAAAYKAQAQVAEQNAKTAEAQGEEAVRRGAREEKRLRREGAQFAGSQLASLAASGGTIGGSSVGVLADTAMGIEEDAEMIRYNTLKDRWGFGVQETNYRNEASAARSAAKNARTAGYIGAFSTLLGTAGQVWGNQPVGVSTGSKLQGGQVVVGQGQSLNLHKWADRWGGAAYYGR